MKDIFSETDNLILCNPEFLRQQLQHYLDKIYHTFLHQITVPPVTHQAGRPQYTVCKIKNPVINCMQMIQSLMWVGGLVGGRMDRQTDINGYLTYTGRMQHCKKCFTYNLNCIN
jgi:hypothetical protein